MSRENSKSLNIVPGGPKWRSAALDDQRIPRMSVGSRKIIGYFEHSTLAADSATRRRHQQNQNQNQKHSNNNQNDSSSFLLLVDDELKGKLVESKLSGVGSIGDKEDSLADPEDAGFDIVYDSTRPQDQEATSNIAFTTTVTHQTSTAAEDLTTGKEGALITTKTTNLTNSLRFQSTTPAEEGRTTTSDESSASSSTATTAHHNKHRLMHKSETITT